MLCELEFERSSQLNDFVHHSRIDLAVNQGSHGVLFDGMIKSVEEFREAMIFMLDSIPQKNTSVIDDRWGELGERTEKEIPTQLPLDTLVGTFPGEESLHESIAELQWLKAKEQELLEPYQQAQAMYKKTLNSPQYEYILEPLVSIFKDGILFEVIGDVDGYYASFFIKLNACKLFSCQEGTARCLLDNDWRQQLQRLRSYKPLHLFISDTYPDWRDTPRSQIIKERKLITKKMSQLFTINSIISQSFQSFSLAMIDLHNIIILASRQDHKQSAVPIFIHLKPNGSVTVSLRGTQVSEAAPDNSEEQWMLCKQSFYHGDDDCTLGFMNYTDAKKLLSVAAASVSSVEVYFNKSLPKSAFILIETSSISYTLAFTHFVQPSELLQTQEVLTPKVSDEMLLDSVKLYLKTHRVVSLDELIEIFSKSKGIIESCLQWLIQQGEVVMDLYQKVYRYRPLIPQSE